MKVYVLFPLQLDYVTPPAWALGGWLKVGGYTTSARRGAATNTSPARNNATTVTAGRDRGTLTL